MVYRSRKLAGWVLALSLLSACGSGGGGGIAALPPSGNTSGGGVPTGDKVTLTISSPSTGTTTTTYLGDQYDPLTTAQTNTVGNTTYVVLENNYNLVTSSWQETLVLGFGGLTPGTYVFSAPTGSTEILYTDVPRNYKASSGSITVSSLGAVGSRVTGTFTGTLVCVSSCTGTADVSGSFSVTRIP